MKIQGEASSFATPCASPCLDPIPQTNVDYTTVCENSLQINRADTISESEKSETYRSRNSSTSVLEPFGARSELSWSDLGFLLIRRDSPPLTPMSSLERAFRTWRLFIPSPDASAPPPYPFCLIVRPLLFRNSSLEIRSFPLCASKLNSCNRWWNFELEKIYSLKWKGIKHGSSKLYVLKSCVFFEQWLRCVRS